jgi:hypothetical protein
MTRLVRRSPRIQRPHRGRAASSSNGSQAGLTPLTVFRQGPPSASPVREKIVYRERVVYKTDYGDIHPVLIKLYRLSPYLFKVLDQPWKWLVALAVLLVLGRILGTLL